ncbi:MAG: hypothetical protein IH840_14095 [Candidatus Heimdallarchaeota archaeon]|nr:hypothetical protein [Candidatus Heimdallarchaeota archaeon]
MWREPSQADLKQLNASIEIQDLIKHAIYWNKKGNLKDSSSAEILQTTVIASFIIFMSIIGLFALLDIINFPTSLTLVLKVISVLLIIGLSGWKFYLWGWIYYYESWYKFDDKDEILTVIRHTEEGWETYDIPYEEINSIDYSGGSNGRGIIKAGKFKFETARSLDKRASSVTEMWDNLARTDNKMNNWPISLHCQNCHRIFGHHIGTAVCPFCNIILIDPKVKGRIDPISLHEDDLDRI